ncbi:hypothetical protein DZF91_19940 [Actinomadura logoneensis]|uniref:Tn3 transposase DDE domain-containing protein n=1 Tax=Actinomadura logoneensis TaxID=2293572 RepID=A0A372JIW8_9ACTN|nr:hypothetical protein DZF91_19940 [Actinomadura logoneensis]
MDAAVKQIRKGGFPATDAMCARLSPIAYEHINFLGRCAFTAPTPRRACAPSTTPPPRRSHPPNTGQARHALPRAPVGPA